VHVCYCLTPMRYVWDQADAYLGRGIRRAIAWPLVSALRRFDVSTSTPDRVSRFIAISAAVAQRIHARYGRTAPVVHPPVDTTRIQAATGPSEDFYFLLGGFVPYKREDVAIEAFRGLDRQLVIAGDGPSRRKLEASAPANVRFVGRIPDAELAEHYRRCRALLYPQEEDFGITALEAQAAGRPVIALGRGGALDTVRPAGPGRLQGAPTGVFFETQTAANLRAAIARFEQIEADFDPGEIRRWAERFSAQRFRKQITSEIEAACGSSAT
jgi:glycosyltransferase involved in cell wall biosynthesis